MEIGKVPNDILRKIVLNKINNKRSEIVLRPQIGEDCCGIDFGEDTCVLSSDPITGTANNIGRLAVHISCNDVASCGVEPIGLLATILLPAGTTEDDLDLIMKQLCETADSLNVDVIGGHTEITDAVNRCVVITTAVGKASKKYMITTSGANREDSIILTKSAGIEGTAIIASEKEDELRNIFGKELIENAKLFINSISVVKEGVLAGKFGVSAMHDVTEGGVLGAAWEVAEASGAGFMINKKDIPVATETEKICKYYGIDPLRLISSGCMIITCKKGEELVNLLAKNGINSAVIGRITQDKRKVIFDGAEEKEIFQPQPDELYKVV